MFRPCFLGSLVFLVATQISAQFQPRVDYPVGPSPYSVAVGDFNGDGIPDLAVSDNGAGANDTISILLGKGDGTFKPHVDYPAGSSPHQVIAADFNRDGKLDLAVVNGVANTVSILIGNGDGTFKPPVSYQTGMNSQWLVAADFNGDGILDIATTDYGPDYSNGSVTVFLGKGDGTFQNGVQYAAGVNPFGIMAADFNKDGKIDLAVVDNNGYYGIWILLGNGDGTFQAPVYYPSGWNPRVGFVADFNGDGNLDIAIANCISNDVSILFGDGLGHFASQVNYPVNVCPQTLAGGDFDGDGKIDLVTANSGSNNVSVLKGNGDGTFQSGASFATGNSPVWVTVADLNNDKAPDLVVTNMADNTVSVLMNTGTDFSIAASPVNPSTINPGQTATSTVSMKLLTLFDNPVTLTCSVQPTQSAPGCSFNPNPASFSGRTATATLTIDTSTTVASRFSSFRFAFLWFPLAGLGLIGASFKSQRRKITACLLCLVFCGGVIFQLACAGTSSGKSLPPPQTYTITVTGTSGANQHSTTLTLTVQ